MQFRGVKNGKGSITMNTMLQPDWTIASVITASIDLSETMEDGVSVTGIYNQRPVLKIRREKCRRNQL